MCCIQNFFLKKQILHQVFCVTYPIQFSNSRVPVFKKIFFHSRVSATCYPHPQVLCCTILTSNCMLLLPNMRASLKKKYSCSLLSYFVCFGIKGISIKFLVQIKQCNVNGNSYQLNPNKAIFWGKNTHNRYCVESTDFCYIM